MSPKLKIKLKGPHFADVAKIQEAVTDELQEVKKKKKKRERGIFVAFQKMCDRAKVCIYVNVAYFEFKKKYVSSSYVFNIKKKSVLKLLDRTVYVGKAGMAANVTWFTGSDIGPETKTYLRNTYFEMLYRVLQGSVVVNAIGSIILQ